MLSAARALVLNAKSGTALPKIPELKVLYDAGCTPRSNEMLMILGRPGMQKSGFALWYAKMLGLRTLYFSADMSPWQASIRLACMVTDRTTSQVESGISTGSIDVNKILSDLKFTFAFGSPIRWDAINAELEAYLELWGVYPELLVFDNLMDFEGAETDYGVQMETLQILDSMKHETGSTLMVLHHATDKGQRAMAHPFLPPARGDAKGGLAEKPELTLGVAIDPADMAFRIAVLKQRMGPSNSSGDRYVTLRADPERTKFRPMTFHN